MKTTVLLPADAHRQHEGFSVEQMARVGSPDPNWIMRRRLERKGMEFQTENDTELIAVYLAHHMSQGATLEDALKQSLEDLDGTYTYMVATTDSVGYAKDKLAAKPMVIYEDDELIASVPVPAVGLNNAFEWCDVKVIFDDNCQKVGARPNSGGWRGHTLPGAGVFPTIHASIVELLFIHLHLIP